MKRRRKRREPMSVSLFPFLAVLICTLGVLIILLVIAVKQADVEAREMRAATEEVTASEIAALELDLSTQQVVVDGLKAVRPDAVARMADMRDRRGHLDDEIRRLDKEAIRLANQVQTLESNSTVPAEEFSDEKIEELQSKLAAAQADVNEVRDSEKGKQPVVYSIVPHSSGSGTNRRPIYLECNDKGVVFQPYNIELNREDFVFPLLPGNPLDAGLLAIREYWTKYDLAGAEGSPYPLIVIRPSGAQNYVMARKAMASWDSEFGYEVVEAGKPLDFGEHDEQLRQILLRVIEDASKQQSQLAVARKQLTLLRGGVVNGRADQVQGLVASGANGGFVSQGGQSSGLKKASFNGPNQHAQATQADSTVPEFNSILDYYRSGAKPGSAGRGSRMQQQSSAGIPRVQTETISQTSNVSTGGASGKAASERGTDTSKDAARKTSSTSNATSIANERGSNWALPSQTPGAVGFLRPIRVHCGPNAIHVYKSKRERTSIPYNGQTQNAVPSMVDNIWQIIDAWGEAGQNGFWKPELRFSVAKTAAHRFEDLKQLLDQSGLSIQGPQQ